MKFRDVHASVIALALAVLACPVSAIAAGPVGSVLDPKGLDASYWPDDQPLSLIHPGRKRTPTGFLYPYPWKTPSYRKLAADWVWRGSYSQGAMYLSGDADEARFQNYADWSEGFIANDLQVSVRNAKSAAHGDMHLSSLGRDDALYRGELGVYGLFRVRGSYDGVPRTYMNDARYLLDGAGGDDLTLPAGLRAGSLSGIRARVDSSLESRLEVLRNRSRVEVWLTPQPWLKLFVLHEYTKREGENALGGLLSPPFLTPGFGGSLIENVSPVSYRDNNVTTGFELAITRVLFKLTYKLSKFENSWEDLTWANPFSAVPSQGRLALPPDNRAHNVRGEVGVDLPFRGRLTSTMSWNSMRQDEKLLPPTINDDPRLSDWNTTAGLSRDHADAKVDTLLSDTRFQVRPWRPITLRVRYRYFDRNNKTDYTALNPLNGVVGYLALDDGLPPSFKERTGNIPYEYTRRQLFAGMTLNPGFKTNINLDYEREKLKRDHRERAKVHETRWRVALSTRYFSFATLRTSYEHAKRDGSTYDSNPNEAFSGLSLFLPVDERVRRFDVAKRKQQLVNVRVNIPILDVLDVSFAGRYRDDDYSEGVYGLRNDDGGEASVEVSYQPMGRLSLHAFMTYEKRRWRIEFMDSGLKMRETGVSAGGGFRLLILTNLVLETNYDFIVGRERQANSDGEDFPKLRSDRHSLVSKLRYQATEYLEVHTTYRYDRGTIGDYQQLDDGQQIAGVANRRLFLGHEDLDYTVHAIGAGVSLSF
ncbi:MAG: MtrB/PioB family decaheme-associated outer membrane protein [Deltaproteobacteria bacterium]|nr:MtrB/PioB family decaheme-associated outer membrane protein [Deltaproteobacteria bacterium]